MVSNKGLLSALAACALSGCAALNPPPPKAAPMRINEDPYPSTYVRYPGALTVVRHATVLTGDGQLIALDCKMSIDGNAMFRHPDIAELRDLHEEDPTEVEASNHDL